MLANEAVGEMMRASGLRQAKVAERLGLSSGNVSSDVHGYVTPGRPRGMTVGKLVKYARACGYELVLVPEDGSRRPIVVDGTARAPKGGGRP